MNEQDGVYAMRFTSQQMLIDKLQQENKQLKENYGRIYNENCKLREEYNITDISLLDENYKLKDNWNKLKEYLHNVDVVIDYSENYDGRFINYDELIDKMQEIEQGSDSNENNNI